jgi:hypothetical protein
MAHGTSLTICFPFAIAPFPQTSWLIGGKPPGETCVPSLELCLNNESFTSWANFFEISARTRRRLACVCKHLNKWIARVSTLHSSAHAFRIAALKRLTNADGVAFDAPQCNTTESISERASRPRARTEIFPPPLENEPGKPLKSLLHQSLTALNRSDISAR